MARSRAIGARESADEATYREIEAWYRARLRETRPPVDLPWNPIYVGPTWHHDGDGWVLPKYSLGWHILGWSGRWLRDTQGVDWQYTAEQARFILWFYAVDANGTWLHDSAVLQRLKGWGKDPLAACMAAAALLAPVTFDHWGDDGNPVGREEPAAWVQCVAVSLDQTKNTMKLFPSLLGSNETRQRFGIQVGKLHVWALGDTRQIEAVTASPLAIEGGRPTLVIRNEALALDTSIPTPFGTTTVGEVRAGDTILGSQGPVEVVKTTEVYTGRPCYRVSFEDGTSLIADEGHLWTARVVASDAKPRVRTTLEMVEDGRKFMVPLCDPLDMPEADLPLDPYVLGYWLGDGSSDCAHLAVGDTDLEWVTAEMQRRGCETRLAKSSGTAHRLSLRTLGARRNRNTTGPLGIYGHLRALGLIKNKHIPTAYLRASRAQRLDLLRGLMDSDGHAEVIGNRAMFSNSNRDLIDTVVELARSLGYRVSVTTRTDTRWASGVKINYLVSLRADEDCNPFLMPRKAERISGHRRAWKSITSIEPVDTVPVKCIEVASDDHLFIAGDGWTLTHNTQNWNASNGGHDMAGAIEGNVAKSPGAAARILDICNAYRPGEDSVAERVRDGWETTQDDEFATRDFGLMYDSLEAPPEAPLTEEAAPSVVESIRGDATWLNTKRIVNSIINPSNSASESRRKWYNQIVASEDARFDPLKIALCRTDLCLSPGDEIVLFGDGSKNDDASGLVACRMSDGLVQLLHVQQPKRKQVVSRSEFDLAVRRAFDEYKVRGFWFDPGHIIDETAEGDERFWWPLCDEWARRWGRQLKYWAVLSGPNRHAIIFDMAIPSHVAQFTGGVEVLDQDIEQNNLRFHRSDVMEKHLKNARRAPNKYGVSMDKNHRESRKKIDLAVCVSGARMLWRHIQLAKLANKSKGAPGQGRVIVLD